VAIDQYAEAALGNRTSRMELAVAGKITLLDGQSARAHDQADGIPDEDRWSRWLIQSKATAEIARER
jgi:hypothetical protein